MRAETPSYADRPDEWLVRACGTSDDEGAFAELVRRYRSPVFRLVVSILGQEHSPEAEDVAQDVMLRVHHALRTFRGEAKFATWIYRIAFNQALNAKSRARHRLPHVSDEVLATEPAGDRGADERLQSERRQKAVLACIHELPEIYQSALRLHYWLGATMSEIADLLDTPENTIKSYLHRARKLLQSLLAERGYDA